MPDGLEAGAEPVAVVGMACRVPGAGDLAAFWDMLVRGLPGRVELTPAQVRAAGRVDAELADPQFVLVAYPLDDVAGFDAGLFGLTAREAELADPQHRLFLELCHAALEDAGHDPARYLGDIGVYGGRGLDAYRWRHVYGNAATADRYDGTTVGIGNHPDAFTTLVSHRLDLRGPSLGVYTACSTSLVAAHIATEALRAGECDMALAGGVSVELPERAGYLYRDGGVESPDGWCRPFDRTAAGTVWGSGGGVVLLKRLADALADGDHIRAVVLGNAVNNDGARKVGYTAPSVAGQAAVITSALAVAAAHPRTIGYVEAHGTATALGDPIEVAALTSAFTRDSTDAPVGWCALGSVKSNLGHLSQGAGVVGMIKTVLALQHGLIPPSLGLTEPAPALGLDRGPFRPATTLSTWDGDGPRRAGVSSFGIGGTNAHVVLEQAPALARSRPASRPAPRLPHLLTVSARSAAALRAAAERLAGHLADRPELDLADVGYTLRVGRAAHPHRLAVVATDPARAAAALREPRQQLTGTAGDPPPVILLFSGQGAQYAGMGAELYRTEPVFADALDRCAAGLAPELGMDLRGPMFASGPERAAADARLAGTDLAQPALFTLGYALAELWESWGLRPVTMLGHSVGEYVAATRSGVFALPDALRLVALRGRLMAALAPGAMLAVPLAEADLAGRLPDGVAVAAVNGPRACVASGPEELVERLAATLAADGVATKRLRTSHAFHSSMMDPVVERFAAAVAGVAVRSPRTPFQSSLTGRPVEPGAATDPGYWAAQLRQPVRFADAVGDALRRWPGAVFLECGPGRQLAGLARAQVPRTAPLPVHSLPGAAEQRGEVATLVEAAGRLWVAGVPVEPAIPGYRTPLPGYPYERTRYWIEPDRPAAPEPAPAAEPRADTRRRERVEDWFSAPTWRRLPGRARVPGGGRYLLFAVGPAGAELARLLRAGGGDVVEVAPGAGYEALASGYRLRPGEPGDYAALLADLAEPGVPDRIVHAWSLAGPSGPADLDSPQGTEEVARLGLWSLLHLVQALAVARSGAVQVDVLTAGACQVGGAEPSRPAQAVALGMVRSAPYDVPWVRWRHLDLPPDQQVAALPAAVAEVTDRSAQAPPAVALRGGFRWVPGLEPVPLPTSDGPAGLRRGGTYLVTGGLGALGLAVAEDLAARAGATVVLVGRRPPASDEPLARIRAAGGTPVTFAADVTDPAALRRVREAVLDRFGGLDGIVHAAGVAGGGVTETRTPARMWPVLAPKVAGTLALRAAFGDLELDFVALFSSTVGLLGGLGEVDYCAANAFLDAYAQSRHGWRARVLSVAWSGWSGGGMLAAPAAARRPDGTPAALAGHPLLRMGADRVGDIHRYHGELAVEREWVLAEHRVSGVALLPGTAQLDALRAAFTAAVPAPPGGGAVQLEDVVFSAPLFVPDGVTVPVEVRVAPAGDRHDLVLAAVVDGRSRVCTRAGARWVPARPPAGPDLAVVRRRCASRPDLIEQARHVSAGGGVAFGPRWDTLRELWQDGSGEQLALLELPSGLAGDLAEWPVHPALLDQATSRYGRYRDGGAGYLPMGCSRVVVYAALPSRVWVYSAGTAEPPAGAGAVYGDDFLLVDDAGRVLVEVDEFLMRRVDHGRVLATGTGAGPDGRVRIAPHEGVAALRALLASDLTGHVVVSPYPLEPSPAPTVHSGQPAPGTGSGTGPAPPTEGLTGRLTAMWSEVLGEPDLGPDDDFFARGGDSLVAVQLVARVRQVLGVKLPMRWLFEAATPAAMAERVAAMGTAPAVGGIPRLARPASFGSGRG